MPHNNTATSVITWAINVIVACFVLVVHFFLYCTGFGRKFENGKSIDFALEQSMGYFMGMRGSAFAGEVAQMARK